MTGELTPIGPVTSQPEARKIKLSPPADAQTGRPDPLPHPERVGHVSRPDKPAADTSPRHQAEPARSRGAAAENTTPPAHEQIEELSRQFSEHLQRLHEKGYLRELRLDYERLDGGGLQVKILDARTDKVIRQIPPEEQVEFAQRMEEVLGVIMDELA